MRPRAAGIIWASLVVLGPAPAPGASQDAAAAGPRGAVESSALTPSQEARALALEGELRCPVCRSQSIRQSRSFMAEDMKRRVRELIAEGRTDADIREYFVARYGEWILLTPPRHGFNLAAYLPILAVAAGAIGLVLAARRWNRRSGTGIAIEPPAESPHLARLERELKETE